MWREKLDCKFTIFGNRESKSNSVTDAKVTIRFNNLNAETVKRLDPALVGILMSLKESNIKSLEFDVSRIPRISIDLDGQKLYNGKLTKLTILNANCKTKKREYILKITFPGNEDFNKRNIKEFPSIKLWSY